jgi:hypothetical protein
VEDGLMKTGRFDDMPANPRVRRSQDARLPLTITLDRTSYRFVEECALQKRFRSVDGFFDAAIAIFRNHIEALNSYIEIEEAKGRSREEILSSTEWEIVFTRVRE